MNIRTTLAVLAAFKIPDGRVHNGSAEGGAAKVIGTYVVDQGKPLASPAP